MPQLNTHSICVIYILPNKISRAVSALCSGLLLSAVTLLSIPATAQATNTPPVMSVNTPLFINQGATVTIGSGNLFASDAESPATGVFFTIGAGGPTGAPHSGTVKISGVPMVVGSVFSQDDVNNGRITLVDGAATIDFGSVIVGNSSAVKTFTVTNSGSAALSGLVFGKDGANAGDFTISALGNTVIAPGGSTTFTVTFNPTAGDSRSAMLHLTNNVIGAKNPFDVTLTGLAYYTQAQFAANRGAGISDVTNAPNTYGLYTTAQVQALNLGTPLLQLNPTNGLFTLTIGVQKSTNLTDYSLFPLTTPQVNVNAQGKLEVQFSPPGNAAFFRLQAQ
jgi:hypothetical protein